MKWQGSWESSGRRRGWWKEGTGTAAETGMGIAERRDGDRNGNGGRRERGRRQEWNGAFLGKL